MRVKRMRTFSVPVVGKIVLIVWDRIIIVGTVELEILDKGNGHCYLLRK